MGILKNATLARLRSGALAPGVSVSLVRNPSIAGILRSAGFDWIAIDMEHGAMTLSEASQICMAALPTGITTIARVKAEALHEAARILDCGAQGVMVPNVDTAAQAMRIVEACRYAPLGRRSWGGGTVHFDGPLPPLADALVQTNAEILLAAMIETAEGVANAAAIAAVPGIDVLFAGALDLSIGVGKPGKLDSPELWGAFETVATACRENGCVMGVGGIYEEKATSRLLAMGARLVAAGGDQAFLQSAAAARLAFLGSLKLGR